MIELEFHYPKTLLEVEVVKVPLKTDDLPAMYRQCICWCLLNRFWYYVLSDPKVSDHEYDSVENLVKKLETIRPSLRGSNQYSPSICVGADNWRGYPASIHRMFENNSEFRKAKWDEQVNSTSASGRLFSA
ncbi:MAG: hypothetical protein E6R03_03755 [Hyphomicrobiaceae bacterium]|nr:MAG: hypothetical protein E6R03_03755 [Hyphomicrobiaceae bacterium]